MRRLLVVRIGDFGLSLPRLREVCDEHRIETKPSSGATFSRQAGEGELHPTERRLRHVRGSLVRRFSFCGNDCDCFRECFGVTVRADAKHFGLGGEDER